MVYYSRKSEFVLLVYIMRLGDKMYVKAHSK